MTQTDILILCLLAAGFFCWEAVALNDEEHRRRKGCDNKCDNGCDNKILSRDNKKLSQRLSQILSHSKGADYQQVTKKCDNVTIKNGTKGK